MRRKLLNGTLSLIYGLKYLSGASATSFRSAFRNRIILDPVCSNTLKILVLFFQIIWFVEFTRPNFRHTSAFFLIFYFPNQFNFFFDAQILLVNVAMLSLYHSPVNCRSTEQMAYA
jgi:hypothetical protein